MSNTHSTAPYRGAGRPESIYAIERLLDDAATELGIDRIELRRRNQIRKSEIPYKAASGATYDSGDFPAILKKALDVSDYKGFAKRKRESKKAGKIRGIGVGCYLEVTAPANKEMGGIRFDADGGVTLRTGTLDYGQGHATPFAQVLSKQLGVPFDKIRLDQGDSDHLLAGGGTAISPDATIDIRDENGKLEGFAVTYRDLSDRKRLEARLAHDAGHDAQDGDPNCCCS